MSLPQTNLESIEKLQELMVPSSSQQLAMDNLKPAAESIKELKKVDTTIPEKKPVTSESDYNSLYKSMESAGKAVGEKVETNKAATSLSQASKTTPPDLKDLNSGKINDDVVLSPTKITLENPQVVAPPTVLKNKGDVAVETLQESAPSIVIKDKVDVAVVKPQLVAPSITLKDKVEVSTEKLQAVAPSIALKDKAEVTTEKSQTVAPSITLKDKAEIAVEKPQVVPPTNIFEDKKEAKEEKPKIAAPSTTIKNKVEDSASNAASVEKSFPVITLENKKSEAAASISLPVDEKIVDKPVTTNPSTAAAKENAEIKVSSAKATSDALQANEKVEESSSKSLLTEKVLIEMTKDNIPSDKTIKEITLQPLDSKGEQISKGGDESQATAATGVIAEKIAIDKSVAAASVAPNSITKVDEQVVPTIEKGTATKTDIVAATTTATTKIAQVSIPKSAGSDERSLAQGMEAAGKAGSDLIQPTVVTEKQALDTSPTYESLFKKIEAAGKASDESSKSTENIGSQVATSERDVESTSSVVTDVSNTETSKDTKKENVDIITSASPPFISSKDASQDAASGGVYMKEAVSALSSLGLPKVTGSLPNSPDYKLPTYNGPVLAVPNFDMSDLKIPSLNIPDLSMPEINIPSMEDIPLAAKVGAGVALVGGTGLAIALSLSDEEPVGSTMPIGAKKKGSSYLEGLSRSSTTLPNKAANGSSSGSNSYLNNLASNTVTPPGAQSANAPYDFAPKPFDPSAESSNSNARPSITAVQESTVSPSFNFAPSVNTNKEPPQSIIGSPGAFNFAPSVNANNEPSQSIIGNSSNEGIARGVPNGEKKKDLSSPSFNFSPKLFDLSNKRGSTAMNGQDTLNGNIGPKPEPPMGGNSFSDNGKNDKYDWGNSSVDGGYVWRDPLQQQQQGSGTGSYLDNLSPNSEPNPYTSPTNSNGGSYNSYLEAMNRQQNQQYQDTNQPSTVKSFSKAPRTGSYVDSL
jgi:hypothetical protein